MVMHGHGDGDFCVVRARGDGFSDVVWPLAVLLLSPDGRITGHKQLPQVTTKMIWRIYLRSSRIEVALAKIWTTFQYETSPNW